VRQPIYQEGLAQWRHYEPFLEPLKAALGPALETAPEPRARAARQGARTRVTSSCAGGAPRD